MSIRSLVELNHDYCPSCRDDEALLKWARGMVLYMHGCDKEMLPLGVVFKHSRHHSAPDPMQGKGDPS